ncbi:GNAT family N-acetyltransferase [Corynebacterium sp.]|uniref:GNAT family N-acetyltransferase n=1 Tax=Corynebacterium sp. TaxID=1720 RepID=UPI0026DAD8BD|nr:GNAT family N-acetyltransferase [Corynebacterium sp.]MDO5033145.1 GNAT family N-acetyltransferase [Corynebacterium sp.]
MHLRPAQLADAPFLAHVHWTSWRETYDLPAAHWESDTLARRTRRWEEMLPHVSGTLVVAEDDDIVGFAWSGPARPKGGDIVREQELYSLYTLRCVHGTGVGARLLRAAVPGPAQLWVAEDNARARAFYRKHGFAEDGARLVDALGITEVRMLR